MVAASDHSRVFFHSVLIDGSLLSRMQYLNASFVKIYAADLSPTYDHRLELKETMGTSDKPIIHNFEIISDQIHVCHLICEENCTQHYPNHTDYFLSSSESDLILFCVKCSFERIYQQLNQTLVYTYWNISRDLARFRVRLLNRSEQIPFHCVNEELQSMTIRAMFHFVDRTENSTAVCAVDSSLLHPYHDQVILQCKHFLTRRDIHLWATTRMSKSINAFILIDLLSSFE